MSTPINSYNKRPLPYLTNPEEHPQKKFKKKPPEDQEDSLAVQETFNHLNEMPINSLNDLEQNSSLSEDNSIEACDSEDDFANLPLKWLDALDAINDDEEIDETPILTLLASNAVDDLSEIEKEIIYESLSSINKNLQLASLSLNLSLKSRFNLLNIGVSKNDIDLVSAAIKGGKGQEKIDLIEATEGQSFIALNLWKNLELDPAIFELLLSISPHTSDDLIDGEWRKFLFNIWSLDDDTFSLNDETIEYQGGVLSYFFSKIQNSFEPYKEMFPHKYNEDLFIGLSSLLESASLSPNEKVQRFADKKDALIHAGSQEHLIDVLLKNGKYVLICDKGPTSKRPVTVIKIKKSVRDKFNDQMMPFEPNDWSIKELKQFYTKKLVKILTGKTKGIHKFSNLFTKHWVGGLKQEANNCIYESTKTAIFAFSAMESILQTKREKSIKPSFEIISDWEMFFKCWGLENYLGYCAENPLRTDYPLLEKIFLMAKQVIKNDSDYSIYFSQIEKTYLNTVSYTN